MQSSGADWTPDWQNQNPAPYRVQTGTGGGAAVIDEQWGDFDGLFEQRAQRVQQIEARIANQRLASALPQLQAFGLETAAAPPQPTPYPDFAASVAPASDLPADPLHQQLYQPYQPPASVPLAPLQPSQYHSLSAGSSAPLPVSLAPVDGAAGYAPYGPMEGAATGEGKWQEAGAGEGLDVERATQLAREYSDQGAKQRYGLLAWSYGGADVDAAPPNGSYAYTFNPSLPLPPPQQFPSHAQLDQYPSVSLSQHPPQPTYPSYPVHSAPSYPQPPPSTLPSQRDHQQPASLTHTHPRPQYAPPPTVSIQNAWSSYRPDADPLPSLSHFSAYDTRPSHPCSALNPPPPLPTSTSLALERSFASSMSSTATTAERSSQSSATTVDFAASNEKLLTTALSATTTKHNRPDSSLRAGPDLSWGSKMPSSTSAVEAAASTVPGRKSKKLTVDLDVDCVSCGQPIARLILRGQPHDLAIPHEAVFTCARCMSSAEEVLPPAVAIPSGLPSASLESPPSDSATPSPTNTAKPSATSSFRKKNKRLNAGGEMLTACDICVRDIATGSVLPLSPELGHSINFQIEVCCVSCMSKYRRCTDCGGGGGARLGTGKWRSKELFKDGKKTCCLRHQRLGAWQEMEYEVWRITDIPPSEVDELSSRCREMFANTMLASIAIPEVLERDGAIWTTFEEAEKHAHAGWQSFGPMFRYDIESSRAIRRYIALRLCPPNFRKSNKKDSSPPNPPANAAGQSEPRVLKDGKEIAGYIISEWDMRYGTVFLALVIPWESTGESFDATTLLIQALLRRVEADERETNAIRASKSEEPVPRLQRVFTMIFFKTGSRMITHLTKKRGFLPLADYLKQHPETDPAQFPPHRPVYLPVERQAGWQVLVRRQKEYDDGRSDDWGARRPADEARGKKKELKVKALKGKKAQEKQALVS
ncbi:hypothetical protein JCM1840_000113 [Sporobolomyces johnsonii]